MAARRQAIELEDKAKLRLIVRSRTEPVSRVEWARILLAYQGIHRFLQSDRRSDCIIRRFRCSEASCHSNE